MAALRLPQCALGRNRDHEFTHLIDLQIASWEMSLGDHRALCVDRPPPLRTASAHCMLVRSNIRSHRG